MDYKDLVELLQEWNEKSISVLCGDDILNCDDLCCCGNDCIIISAATAITDLLARAEAAEARCETLEKIIREYQDTLIPGYRSRAEEAEADLAQAVRDMSAMAATIRARKLDDTDCCPWCKHNCPPEDYCPGWDGKGCFAWRGRPC